MSIAIARLSGEPLDLGTHLDAVEDPTAGAVATFIGRVRNHDPEAAAEVTALDYTAHPDAEARLHEIVARFDSDVVRIAVSHRTGRVDVGGTAIIACVASAHRAEAFDVCRELVEAIKHELPVWKQQLQVDGAHSWVGLS
ncbi:molybdenum cofactor biosynthesis protein MoaE [Rathayibacter sp. YIM 133350]|uniref:molybdenum cofactor biosynthesis protein MoaE n=1 Tax=Rathayibacter sp. YIM 133350 TaxID=3131992 RepID=UPI00307DF0CC